MKKRRLRKFLSIKLATDPGQVVLFGIFVLNVLLFFVTTIALMETPIPETDGMGFGEASFFAIRIIMTGNLDFVINEIGGAGAAVCILHVVTTVLGTIFFTGSLIAYLTNTIAKFMSYNNPVGRSLKIYDHIVLLGWNTRAPEIVRNLLYTGKRHEVVIITSEDREKIKNIIDETIKDCIVTNNKRVKEAKKSMSFVKRWKYGRNNKMRNRLVVIIRRGETYSSQLMKDIALSTASAVIILGEDATQMMTPEEEIRRNKLGNSQILKTVMQVVDITSAEDSANDQNVIVEVDDDMTHGLINKVINDKNAPEKCSVIPVPVTRTIGSLVAMFALNPSLGAIYNEIFTIGGMDIGVEKTSFTKTLDYVRDYLATHVRNLPLNLMNAEGGYFGFYVGESEEKREARQITQNTLPDVKITFGNGGVVNDIIVFGHSTKLRTILSMIDSAVAGLSEEVRIMLFDDTRRVGLSEIKHCKVTEVYSDDLDAIEFFVAINKFMASAKRDVTIILLSDDTVSMDALDDDTIANLIRLKEIMFLLQEKGTDMNRIHSVVEIMNPTHYDIVRNYGVKDVIISNRLTSKMITQFAFESSLFDMYRKMISRYGAMTDGSGMEIFTQYASEMFEGDIPQNVNAYDLVNAVFESSITKDEYVILMGIVDNKGDMLLFDSDRRDIYPSLTPKTMLICYRGKIAY